MYWKKAWLSCIKYGVSRVTSFDFSLSHLLDIFSAKHYEAIALIAFLHFNSKCFIFLK